MNKSILTASCKYLFRACLGGKMRSQRILPAFWIGTWACEAGLSCFITKARRGVAQQLQVTTTWVSRHSWSGALVDFYRIRQYACYGGIYEVQNHLGSRNGFAL